MTWTAADSAELDVLADALAGAVLDHRQRCGVCKLGGPWCAALVDCFNICLEWRNSRRRLSDAQWLRERLDDFEWLQRHTIPTCLPVEEIPDPRALVALGDRAEKRWTRSY